MPVVGITTKELVVVLAVAVVIVVVVKVPNVFEVERAIRIESLVVVGEIGKPVEWDDMKNSVTNNVRNESFCPRRIDKPSGIRQPPVRTTDKTRHSQVAVDEIIHRST